MNIFSRFSYYKPIVDNYAAGHGLLGPQGHGWQDLQRELLNIATHNLYISSEPHDFREEDFFLFFPL